MFEKYDAYKDSGVEWLGQVPTHWHVTRIKNLFRLVMDFAPKNNNEELLSVYTDIGVKPRKELEERGNKASTTDGYLFVQKGDIVVNKLLAWMGAIGLSEYNGVTSPAYDILRPKVPMISKFYHNMFRMPVFSSELKKHSRGIMDMRLRLYFDKFGDVLVPSPPFEEQTAIIQFLDQKTAEIDQAIAIKEQQIALLNERKQIVIQKAVTQGLDPNVPMKDSGVEWIGQIPEHWVVTKLKRLTRQIVDGAHFTPTYVDKGVPFLRVTDLTSMQNGEIQWENVRYIPEKEHLELIKRAKPQKGDVLISKNGTIGVTKVIDWDVEFSIFVSLCLVKLRPSIDAKYFEAFFNSPIVDKQISFGSSRTSVTNLHLEKIKELLIILPPVEEQEIIAQEVEKINQLYLSPLNNLEEQISKLKEYKTTLINDAVTGKIKVA